MATAVEQDEFEDEAVPAARPVAVENDVPMLDKISATAAERLRMDLLRVQERKMGMLLGAVVLITLTTILGITWMALFYGAAPDMPFTPPTRRIITTENITYTVNETSEFLEASAEVDDYRWERSVIDENDESNTAGVFCATAHCRDTVRFVEDQLDTSYDPCSSLYDHVCSRWQQQYKEQPSGDGRISVDDVIVGAYRKRLAVLLSDSDGTFPEARGLFLKCAHEGLATQQDVARMLSMIPPIGDNASDESVAKGIARLASLGVSPFFDVVANVTNGTAYVSFLTASLDGKNSNDDVPVTGMAGARVSSSVSGRKADSVFLSAFRRQLCLEVKQVVRDAKRCVLSLSSNFTVHWNRRWFETAGTRRLRDSAVSLLRPILLHADEDHRKAQNEKHPSFSPAEIKEERLLACLRLMDASDSASVRSFLENTVPPVMKAGAKKTLLVLEATLGEAFPGASSISFELGPPPPEFANKTPLHDDESHVYINASTNRDTKLEKLLRVATWRQWLNHGAKDPAALSTVARFVERSSTLHVPLPVFNASSRQDPWLRNLSLARVGPRVLKTLFRDRLAAELNESQVARCASKRQALAHLKTEKSGRLDLEEVASFYASLRAYREQVGEAVPIADSDLDSDSLFLLFYVLNNCEVVSGDREPSLAGTLVDRGRRQVDSVAEVFASALLERCQRPSETNDCDVLLEPSIFHAARSHDNES